MTPRCPVIVLLGATAVGKTELSIELARAIGAEIISVDSRLLYRGMDIGTAKPSRAEMDGIAHHLIDVAEPSERWSLSRYLDMVKGTIAEMHSAGKIPLLVGGTGQYLVALVEGWQPPPKADDPGFRASLRELASTQGEAALHARLREIDPDTAERIDERNVRRVIRALEIHHVTGAIPSEQRRKTPPDYSFLLLGLRRDRAELYDRIDERIEAMLSSGLVEEVSNLIARGADPESSALSAIGYRQIAAYLQGKYDLDTAVAKIQRLTRQFVRRQDNWFRRLEPDIYWFTPGEVTLQEVVALVRNWLSGDAERSD